MPKVAIAASSNISAAAGARVAEQGGNAVDAALAAAMVSMTTEPGVVSLAGGGFITIWADGSEPVTIDGNVAMPGRGRRDDELGRGAREVTMGYGGGVSTLIGHGSVAIPGALAACDMASQRYGQVAWQALVEPAFEHARNGFPLPQASWNYLEHAGECVYGWHADSRTALFGDDDVLARPGDTIHVPHLADSLRSISDHGADTFYRGAIAEKIVADMDDNEGVLTAADLDEYEPLMRKPMRVALGKYDLAINPPPAVGGVTLAAMLTLMGSYPRQEWQAADVARLAAVQHAVLSYRRQHLDLSDELDEEARRLLQLCRDEDFAAIHAPSTVHISAVDSHGLACSVTLSSGYGAGVMPPGTGIWLNNTLGEIELNRRGLIAGPPGMRLASNMAPTVARAEDGALLAIGSPGADRITTAMLQTLINLMQVRMSLDEAVAYPRLHVEFPDAKARIAAEPGLDLSACELPARQFDEQSMFFGGVAAALRRGNGEILAAADSRRAGGSRVT
ncbi:MAG: gamma-glutamyltransferase family protein [Gammaproteobacteria bacterium]|nr:gamma-glutamyltransferase family protein [Gammaproteobacteria bacterium]NND58862.1 gamma-glutamyltransferase [Gammaproteobacteria bacterium]